MGTRDGKVLLTPDDWTGAALDAMAHGGVANVAVDRLAKQLGASRGSFYWHFSDRADLIDRALARWERQNTTERTPDLAAGPDPGERLRRRLAEVYERPVDPVELWLTVAGDDPTVAAVVGRVTGLRLAFLERIFDQLDMPDAADRAWLAYGFYVGHHQLTRNRQTTAPADLDAVLAVLTARR